MCDGRLGRQDGRGHQRHPRRPVQQEQDQAVDTHADDPNDDEPPQPIISQCRSRSPPTRPQQLVQIWVHRTTRLRGFGSLPGNRARIGTRPHPSRPQILAPISGGGGTPYSWGTPAGLPCPVARESDGATAGCPVRVIPPPRKRGDGIPSRHRLPVRGNLVRTEGVRRGGDRSKAVTFAASDLSNAVGRPTEGVSDGSSPTDR